MCFSLRSWRNGRRTSLRGWRWQQREGSNPSDRTKWGKWHSNGHGSVTRRQVDLVLDTLSSKEYNVIVPKNMSLKENLIFIYTYAPEDMLNEFRLWLDAWSERVKETIKKADEVLARVNSCLHEL